MFILFKLHAKVKPREARNLQSTAHTFISFILSSLLGSNSGVPMGHHRHSFRQLIQTGDATPLCPEPSFMLSIWFVVIVCVRVCALSLVVCVFTLVACLHICLLLCVMVTVSTCAWPFAFLCVFSLLRNKYPANVYYDAYDKLQLCCATLTAWATDGRPTDEQHLLQSTG